MFNTIDPEVKGTLIKFREACRLWDHLKTCFATNNDPHIQQICSSIACCEQTKSMSPSVYYGKLNALWQELQHHVPLVSSTCCSKCNIASIYVERREHEKLHDFVMGLKSEIYARLRTQILSMDPLLSLDRAYNWFPR